MFVSKYSLYKYADYNTIYATINSQENTCARVSFLIKLQALGFEGHASTLFKKADQEVNASGSLKSHLQSNKKNLLLSSVIKSQFIYFPRIWILMSRYLNNTLMILARKNYLNTRIFRKRVLAVRDHS